MRKIPPPRWAKGKMSVAIMGSMTLVNRRGSVVCRGSPEGKKLFSLEDVNEEILRLEEELKKMKVMRDRLVEAHYMYMNGQLEELKKQGRVHQMAEL